MLGLVRSGGKKLIRFEDGMPSVLTARDRQRHPQVGDGEGVQDELAAGPMVFKCPIDVGIFEAVLDLEKLRASRA